MKLKELSSATDISERTIRYYISDGIFLPESYTENYTGRKKYDYTENDVKRLRQIALLRKYDFSIKDIKAFFAGEADIVSVLKENIEHSKENAQTKSENISVMESVLKNEPKTVDELCEMLSNPVIEQTPVPSIDDKSAFEPMYKKSRKLNTAYIVLISVISTLAVLMGLYFGWYYLMTGLPIKADVGFEATEIYSEPLSCLKDNVYYDTFYSIISENYNLSKKKIKELYKNADDYVVITIYGNAENYHEYNVFKFRPKKIRIIGADDGSFLVAGQESGKISELYYNYLLSGKTWEEFPIDLLMKKETYDKLESEGRLKPENISAEIECEVFYDPIYESNIDTPPIEIVDNASFFSDYELKNDKVYIYCTVTVKNNLDTAQQFMIQGNFEKDYISGFVKEQIICAYDAESLSNNMFIITAKAEQMLKVCFISDWGGKATVKQNRLLPEIQLYTNEINAIDSNAMEISAKLSSLIRDKENIDDFLSAFEEFCKTPIDNEGEILSWEVYENEFSVQVSLVRQGKFPDDADEYTQIRLDLYYKPTKKLKYTLLFSDEYASDEDFFNAIRDSKSYKAIKDNELTPIKVEVHTEKT